MISMQSRATANLDPTTNQYHCCRSSLLMRFWKTERLWIVSLVRIEWLCLHNRINHQSESCPWHRSRPTSNPHYTHWKYQWRVLGGTEHIVMYEHAITRVCKDVKGECVRAWCVEKYRVNSCSGLTLLVCYSKLTVRFCASVYACDK